MEYVWCTDALGKVSRSRHGRSYSPSRNHGFIANGYPQAYRTLYSPVGSFGSFSTALIRGALDASFSRLLQVCYWIIFLIFCLQACKFFAEAYTIVRQDLQDPCKRSVFLLVVFSPFMRIEAHHDELEHLVLRNVWIRFCMCAK